MATTAEIRRSKHKCVWCEVQDERTLSGQWFCDSCAEKRRKYQRTYNARAVERYHRNKENGVCAKCGAPLDNETTWCNFCRIKQAEATRRYEGRLRDAQG